jgi:hypothetical protein
MKTGRRQGAPRVRQWQGNAVVKTFEPMFIFYVKATILAADGHFLGTSLVCHSLAGYRAILKNGVIDITLWTIFRGECHVKRRCQR